MKKFSDGIVLPTFVNYFSTGKDNVTIPEASRNFYYLGGIPYCYIVKRPTVGHSGFTNPTPIISQVRYLDLPRSIVSLIIIKSKLTSVFYIGFCSSGIISCRLSVE